MILLISEKRIPSSTILGMRTDAVLISAILSWLQLTSLD